MAIPSDKSVLRRSNDKYIAGVCGGVAEYFGWSVDRLRIVYLCLSLLSAGFPGGFLYLVLWFLMPPPETTGFHLEDFRKQ